MDEIIGSYNAKYKYLIGSEWRESKNMLDLRNPYNNDVVSATFLATEKDVNDAIQAAVRAYAGHKDTQRPIESLLRYFMNICLSPDGGYF